MYEPIGLHITGLLQCAAKIKEARCRNELATRVEKTNLWKVVRAVRRDISRAKTVRTDMGTANSAGTHSDSVLAHYFEQKKKGVPMSTPGQQLAELHQRVVQEELGLPATIDDRDCVVFEHPELSL